MAAIACHVRKDTDSDTEPGLQAPWRLIVVTPFIVILTQFVSSSVGVAGIVSARRMAMNPAEKLASSLANNNRIALLCGSAILAAGFALGSTALANGLVRMQRADREVTVRGVAQRDVTANRASWRVSYSESAYALPEALAEADRDTALIRTFLKEQGFAGGSTEPGSAGISVIEERIKDKPTGRTIYTVGRAISFSTDNVAGVLNVEARKDALARQGLVVDDTSVSYEYTQLDRIKPAMIADATRDARQAAEKFAADSGSSVGGIRSATQGYFTVSGRDAADSGEEGMGGSSSTTTSPEQRVRVVTTIDYYLD